MLPMRLFAALLLVPLLLWAALARAESLWPMDLPLPQDALTPVSLKTLDDKREDIQQAMVVVKMGHGEDNPRWMMSQTQLQVLINKLFSMPDKPLPEDDIWPKLTPINKGYTGITVLIQMVDGKRFEPLRIFEGRVTGADGHLVVPDFGRRLEYWMFGTARVRRDQLLGVNVLPVLSFEQCRLLGQRIVETSPRQCLLPDNNLLLETSELPTLASARLRDFDGCLREGKALIYTFPRRCVAAGGRVFTEPPRVYDDLKSDAPVAARDVVSGSRLKSLILKSMAVSPSAPVSDVQVPGGGLMISPSMSVPVGAPVSVSGTQALNDAELARIAPAAGPEAGFHPLRWLQRAWSYELADFGF